MPKSGWSHKDRFWVWNIRHRKRRELPKCSYLNRKWVGGGVLSLSWRKSSETRCMSTRGRVYQKPFVFCMLLKKQNDTSASLPTSGFTINRLMTPARIKSGKTFPENINFQDIRQYDCYIESSPYICMYHFFKYTKYIFLLLKRFEIKWGNITS